MDGDESSGGGGGGALVTRRRSSAARPPQVNATATRPWAATPVTTPSPKGVSTALLRALFGDAGGGDDSVPLLHLNSAVCPTPKAHVACAG